MPAVRAIAVRCNTTQQVDFIRETFSFTNSGQQLIGSMPVGAVILDVSLCVTTAFNAASTNPITLGVTPGGSELIAAGDNTPGTPGFYRAARGFGNALTQAPTPVNSIGDSEGGVGVYLNYAPTGTAATTGAGVVVVTYVPQSTTSSV